MVSVDVVVGLLTLALTTVFLQFCDAHENDVEKINAGGYQPQFGQAKPIGKERYLLYDVNPGEGFNLRRDVYMRVANLVKVLNDDPGQSWTLVLPPWGNLYHWKSHHLDQIKLPWRMFFDLDSLSQHVPVMEYEDFIKETGAALIEEVYYLQGYKEGWTDGKWEQKMDLRDCIEHHGYTQDSEGYYRGWFWGFDETKAPIFKCLSVQSEAIYMKDFLMKNTSARSVAFLRAERLIHGMYSEWSPEWWTARRSMRFAAHLRNLGDEFRAQYLDSDDVRDKTTLEKSWKEMKREHGDALGGPYVAVHWRRADFLYAHGTEIPDIKGAAIQLKRLMDEYKLNTLFVATDAPSHEYDELKSSLDGYNVHRFTYDSKFHDELKDGGVAIIDQYICAHARAFVGSFVSTFSFRIHEEREILGFQQDTTFKRLCPDPEVSCEQPSKWDAKY